MSTPSITSRSQALPRRVPLVPSDEDWFWDRVGADTEPVTLEPTATDDSLAWALVAAPLLAVLHLVLLQLLHVSLPATVLVGEVAVVLILLALEDAARLVARGVPPPSYQSAFLTPVYLAQRSWLSGDPLLPVAWCLAATGVLLGALALG